MCVALVIGNGASRRPISTHSHEGPMNMRRDSQAYRYLVTAVSSLTLLITAPAQQPSSQNDEESSRQIVLDRFNTARPTAEAAKGGANAGAAVKRPVYRRTG